MRSWRDADNDGYGDLRGIVERLDPLSWLAVDGIWLSPMMPSRTRTGGMTSVTAQASTPSWAR
ncbi:MAG TPA: alpha-amylase family glycosyl hydrolase [Trebonia sp.]|nr:alpha-amylase family glycosyl hydrolase [Trebonia sp.]